MSKTEDTNAYFEAAKAFGDGAKAAAEVVQAYTGAFRQLREAVTAPDYGHEWQGLLRGEPIEPQMTSLVTPVEYMQTVTSWSKPTGSDYGELSTYLTQRFNGSIAAWKVDHGDKHELSAKCCNCRRVLASDWFPEDSENTWFLLCHMIALNLCGCYEWKIYPPLQPLKVEPPAPLDPLDCLIDGLTVRECLVEYELGMRYADRIRHDIGDESREDRQALVCGLNAAQLESARSAWSASLRAKLAASAEKQRNVVLREMDEDGE